jgi:hypothetical protein
MQITCSSCGAPVAARDINLDRMLAKCESCNAVFDISAQMPRPEGVARVTKARRLVGMPRGIRVVVDETVPPGGPGETGETGEPYRLSAAAHPHVVLERSWFAPTVFFMAFFCVFWDGFLVFWYAMALSAKGAHAHAAPLLFPLLHVGAGIAITYTTICGFVNTTRIAIENGALSVRHGPLPWPGNRDVAIASIVQLFCREHVGNKGSRSYSVNALLKQGTTSTVLKGLTDAEQALYIEQIVEKRLGIVDAPVAGEYG